MMEMRSLSFILALTFMFFVSANSFSDKRIPYNYTFGYARNFASGNWWSNSVPLIEECNPVFTYLATGIYVLCIQTGNSQNQLTIAATDGVLNTSAEINLNSFGSSNFTCSMGKSASKYMLVYSVIQELLDGIIKPVDDVQQAATGSLCDFVILMIPTSSRRN